MTAGPMLATGRFSPLGAQHLQSLSARATSAVTFGAPSPRILSMNQIAQIAANERTNNMAQNKKTFIADYSLRWRERKVPSFTGRCRSQYGDANNVRLSRAGSDRITRVPCDYSAQDLDREKLAWPSRLIRSPQSPHRELDPTARQLPPSLDLRHVGFLRVFIEKRPRRLAGLVSGLGERLPDVAIVPAGELPPCPLLGHPVRQFAWRSWAGHRDTPPAIGLQIRLRVEKFEVSVVREGSVSLGIRGILSHAPI